jgi:hypothetical protein
MKTHWCLASLALAGSALLALAETPTVKVTLVVTSPDNRPVSGAVVGIGGGLSTPTGTVPRAVNGTTDGAGRFTAEVACLLGEVSAFARREGYYESTAPLLRLSSSDAAMKAAQIDGRWQPWERSIAIVLNPVKKPVPMYAKHLVASLPATDDPVGYDLEKGDWVAPFGKGERVDFQFQTEGSIEGPLNYHRTLRLRLPGNGNGILAYDRDPASTSSALLMPYEAPVDGYRASWTWQNARRTENTPGARSTFVDETHIERGFIFRVRAAVDSQGRVTGAWYGKINGAFIFDARGDHGHGFVNFTYYLNPDRTRNLEFDPARNLFPDQEVKAP